MRKLKQRLFSLLLCTAMLFSLCVPAAAEEDTVEESTQTVTNVPYLDESGNERTCAEATIVTGNDTVWDTSKTSGWYVASGTVEIPNRVTVTGDIHLILKDSCTLKAAEGINVGEGNSLTIYGQSAGTGKLTATGSGNAEDAGIGGNGSKVCGDITINGGTIEAEGGSNAAGIGSGGNGAGSIASSGNVTIHGGNITASSSRGTAIGGGTGGGSVTITGGTVTAKGEQDGGTAGISGRAVAISGGEVTATSSGSMSYGIFGGSVSISGGEVKATSNGAGIGGDYGGTITINGGTVTATGSNGVGIGSYGSIGSSGGGTITISGGTVTATSSNGAGIGGLEGFSSTFSTGTGGNAFIVASRIEDQSGKSSAWSGVIFEGTENGKVYGSEITLAADAEIPAGKELEIGEGQTLIVGADVKLTNSGTITSSGTIINNGRITGSGTIIGTVDNHGTIEDGITVQDHTHQWDTAQWSSDATNHWHGCTVTGCNERSDTAAHTPGDWIVDRAATSTEAGSRHKACSVCGYVTATETIPATGGNRGGGDYTPPTYKPEVSKPGEGGGTPSISPSKPEKGDTVTVTPKPDDGYEVDKITVTDRNGKAVEVTVRPDGTYTFTQPAGKVKIEVTYTPVQPVETPWSNPFTDVSEGDWYYEAVRFVQEQGLMNGIGNGGFAPNAQLSRAQLAQILFNKEGGPAVSGGGFNDVDSGAWYADAVTWAAGNGIVGGYGDGRFGPNDPITREQLAVMLWRYSGSPAATNKEPHFNDESEISGFALDALRWAVENGILNGYGDGRLGPQGQATRAQVAQMLKNFIENQEENT